MKSSIRTWMAVCSSGLTITAFTVLADPPATAVPPEHTYTGLVASVDPNKHELRVKKSWLWRHHRFNLADNCAYTLLDNNPGTLNGLRPGEKVTVRYQDVHGVLIADRVEQQPMRYDGMVAAIDPAKHTLVLHQPALDTRLQLAGDCAVLLRGDRPGTFADIQPGSHVTVTYELPGDTPTARQVEQTSDSFTGKLTAIDLNDRTVKAKSLLEAKQFNVADNCIIMVNGKSDGRLRDLKPGEKLVFSFNAVNGVNVVDRIAPAETTANAAGPAGPVTGYAPVTGY